MQGLGQHDAAFASPDAPSGILDYQSIAPLHDEGTILAGQGQDPLAGTQVLNVSGMYPEAPMGAATHISTGSMLAGSHPGRRAQHWSNLLDVHHGPLFWLLLATIIYFGLITVQVGARVGHAGFRIGTSR